MNTIHIAYGSPSSTQNGSALKPYQVRTATHFDAIFRRRREPTMFKLHPGEYRTKGCWAFEKNQCALLAPNCHLVGTHGSNATFLRLDSGYVSKTGADEEAAYVETVIGGGCESEGSDQMMVAGLTIDATAARVPSSGLHTYSGGTVIEDVRVVGVSGKWGAAEGFGILVNDSRNARNGGNRIRNSSVAIESEDNYCNGIYLGSVTAGGAPNLIDSCFATAVVHPGKRAHTAYACNENTAIRNCVGSGFDRFCFSDTGNVGDVFIAGCRADFGYCAVDFPAPSSGDNPIEYRRRIRVSGCTFRNEEPSGDHAIGILVQDNTERNRAVKIEDIDVDGCRFQSALPAGQFFVCSIKALLTKRVWIRNSVFPEDSQTRNGVYSPTPQSEVRIKDVP